jgi:hypothetical protein
MFKDKSYLNFKSFNKNYHLFEGEWYEKSN